MLWPSQEGDCDGLRDQKGFGKSKHLRWFLKHKKNFNRKKWGSAR